MFSSSPFSGHNNRFHQPSRRSYVVDQYGDESEYYHQTPSRHQRRQQYGPIARAGRRQQQYYTQDELFELQREKQQREEAQLLKYQQHQEHQRQLAEQRRTQHLQEHNEKLKQRKLFILRATIATRTIQRAWRQHQQRQTIALQQKQTTAAVIIARAINNFGPIVQAKKVRDSLRRLKSISEQVEDVDSVTAVRTGAGITLFEHTLDGLVAQLDSIDSWGSQTVRSIRKQIVIRANERTQQQVVIEPAKQQSLPQLTPTPPTETGTGSGSESESEDMESESDYTNQYNVANDSARSMATEIGMPAIVSEIETTKSFSDEETDKKMDEDCVDYEVVPNVQNQQSYFTSNRCLPPGKVLFEPKLDWQPVLKNHVLPKGLYIRANMTTGVKEAKILIGT